MTNPGRTNLNLTEIPSADGNVLRFADHSLSTSAASVNFRDCEGAVVRFIEAHDAVFGCVAWLTNRKILSALSKKSAQIVVQKEDFLRPEPSVDWRGWVRPAYDAICGFDRGWLHLRTEPTRSRWSIDRMSYACDTTVAGVRCFGVRGDRSKTPPRMHHKFAVGCSLMDVADGGGGDPIVTATPLRVLTGSFNWTENGGHSLENVVVLNDPVIAAHYLAEYEQILCCSEPLDWRAEYVDPEWRVGT